jgi:hypothetical protein
MISASRAVLAWPSQSMSVSSNPLIRPKSLLNMSRQIKSMAKDGIAYGSIRIVR